MQLDGRMRTQTRCLVLPSGQVGSSSATRIANMWAMQRPRAVPAAAILPLKYGNVPNSGSCGACRRCQASLCQPSQNFPCAHVLLLHAQKYISKPASQLLLP